MEKQLLKSSACTLAVDMPFIHMKEGFLFLSFIHSFKILQLHRLFSLAPNIWQIEVQSKASAEPAVVCGMKSHLQCTRMKIICNDHKL